MLRECEPASGGDPHRTAPSQRLTLSPFASPPLAGSPPSVPTDNWLCCRLIRSPPACGFASSTDRPRDLMIAGIPGRIEAAPASAAGLRRLHFRLLSHLFPSAPAALSSLSPTLPPGPSWNPPTMKTDTFRSRRPARFRRRHLARRPTARPCRRPPPPSPPSPPPRAGAPPSTSSSPAPICKTRPACGRRFPAKVTIPTDNNNARRHHVQGQTRGAERAPARLPRHPRRHEEGMTNARVFCVDDLPEVAEIATNRDVKTPRRSPPLRRQRPRRRELRTTSRSPSRQSSASASRSSAAASAAPSIRRSRLYDASGPSAGGHERRPGLQTDCRITYVAGQGRRRVRRRARRQLSRRGRLPLSVCASATSPAPRRLSRFGQARQQDEVAFTGPAGRGRRLPSRWRPGRPDHDSVQIAPKGANNLHGWPVLRTCRPRRQVRRNPTGPQQANRSPCRGHHRPFRRRRRR